MTIDRSISLIFSKPFVKFSYDTIFSPIVLLTKLDMGQAIKKNLSLNVSIVKLSIIIQKQDGR